MMNLAMLRNKKGQGALEYVMILGIVLVIVALLWGTGALNTAVNGITTWMHGKVAGVTAIS